MKYKSEHILYKILGIDKKLRVALDLWHLQDTGHFMMYVNKPWPDTIDRIKLYL